MVTIQFTTPTLTWLRWLMTIPPSHIQLRLPVSDSVSVSSTFVRPFAASSWPYSAINLSHSSVVGKRGSRCCGIRSGITGNKLSDIQVFLKALSGVDFADFNLTDVGFPSVKGEIPNGLIVEL